MANRPILTDVIVIAISRLVDESQSEKREPTRSDIEFQIDQAKLTGADPARLSSKPTEKSKRCVRLSEPIPA